MINKKFALLICDLQTKTLPNLFNNNEVVYNVNKLLYMKKYIPEISIAVKSEFIPNKLGYIDPSINGANIDLTYTKNTYSMLTPQLSQYLKINKINNIILTGMETQWCINKTTLDLAKTYNVHIPADAIGNSLNLHKNKYNLDMLKYNGAHITSTDFLICSFLNNYNQTRSKKYLNIIKSENSKQF